MNAFHCSPLFERRDKGLENEMEKEQYQDIFENIANFVIKVSEGGAKVVEGINNIVSSEAFREFVEILSNIPDDIKETQFFGKVQQLKNKNLRYEDVVWLIDDFGFQYTEESWEKYLECDDKKSELYRYIAEIIVSREIEKREKTIILLAHMEPLIYDSLNMPKVTKSKLKDEVTKVSIKENKEMSAEGLGKIYALAVTYIVFANTDSYTEEIDKRIPFRNHILHNGIFMYQDDEIETLYGLLVDLIKILIQVKERAFGE